jgi:hypothetical protein
MARAKKSSSPKKKPPARPRSRRPARAREVRAPMEDLLDEAVRETANDFACSVDICRHFAEQLDEEIADREPVLPLTQLAVDLWREHRAEKPELVATLHALFEERLRHDAAIVELGNRFVALGKEERGHADLSPIAPIEELVRKVLVESATRAVLADDDDTPPERGSYH